MGKGGEQSEDYPGSRRLELSLRAQAGQKGSALDRERESGALGEKKQKEGTNRCATRGEENNWGILENA